MSARRLLAPRYWAYHLVALVCVGVAVGLGSWQYDAWQQRRAAEARDLTRLEPVPLSEVMGPDDPFPGNDIGRPVALEGTWVPEGTVYVEGREHEETEGYWVVTPLAIDSPDGPALLVVRGWAPSPEQAPAPPTGEAELVALLQPAEGTGAVDGDPRDDVLPQLRVADVLQKVDRDLYGAYAVVPGDADAAARSTNDGTAGLEPAALDQLPPVGQFTAVRNLLYAVEWWVFGAFAAFIWWRWTRDELAAQVGSAP